MKKGDNKKFFKKPRTFGERASDRIAEWAGSWVFIIGFILVLMAWMGVNTYMWYNIPAWDKYPFILLNLVLSCIAALQAPIILMSQNRQADKDRQKAEYDYSVNRRSERMIEQILVKVKALEAKNKKKKR